MLGVVGGQLFVEYNNKLEIKVCEIQNYTEGNSHFWKICFSDLFKYITGNQ
jgi:hypothetical protein